jgi:hypothetical protein
MRHPRRRHFRRRPRRFRFRPRGFSGRLAGPIYRSAFRLLGVPPEQRRSAYNLIAAGMVVVLALGVGISSFGSGGVAALVLSLMFGGFVVTVFRFYR